MVAWVRGSVCQGAGGVWGVQGCVGRHVLLHVGQEFRHDGSELSKRGTIFGPEGGGERI